VGPDYEWGAVGSVGRRGRPTASLALILMAVTDPVAPAWRANPMTNRMIPGTSRVDHPSMRTPRRPSRYGGVQTTAPSMPPMAAAAIWSRFVYEVSRVFSPSSREGMAT